MKLTHQQRTDFQDTYYAMFDPLGNLMVGQYLVNLLETKDITTHTHISEIIDIAYAVGEQFPETEADDTAVREAIVCAIERIVLNTLSLEN